MLKISIIIPYVRPQLFENCVKTIKQNAGIPSNEYEIVSEFDKDRIGAPKMVKKLVEKALSHRVMFLGEDTLPQPDFLKNALCAINTFPDGIGLAALNDGMFIKPGVYRRCKLACHWLADKRLLPMIGGEFFYTGYVHRGCDNELTEKCYLLKRYLFSQGSVIKHRPIKDGDYLRVNTGKNKEYDALLLRHRRLNNWQTKLDFTGERCVPERMAGNIKILMNHISRYNFALMYARKKTKVLDASCGSGFGTNMLSDVAGDILGVDVDAPSIDYARHRYNGRFEWYDLNKEFPDEQFNIIVSFETIEHLDNPEFFLDNASKHSKEFLFSVPINHPSKFHKRVFSGVEEVEDLILKYFSKVEWFSQYGLNIVKGFKKSKYLLGHAKRLDD